MLGFLSQKPDKKPGCSWASVCKAVALAAISTYPFYAVVKELSVPLAERFVVPCSGEGCLFIRYISSPGLPSTQVMNLDRTRIRSRAWAFARVVNGQDIMWSEFGFPGPWFHPVTLLYRFYTILPSIPIAWSTQKREPLKSPLVRHAETVCKSEDVRKNMHNHLNDGYAGATYMYGIVGWGALTAVHDVALVARRITHITEAATVSIGIMSWLAQVTAAVAGLFWAINALEVFYAEVPGLKEVCYYQLGGLASFAAMGTPALLMFLAVRKSGRLALSVLYGDFLYVASYDVPMRVVEATVQQNPFGSLLLPGIAGAKSIEEPSLRTLPARTFMIFAGVNFATWLAMMITVSYFVLPLFGGVAYVRLLVIASQAEYGLDMLGVLKGLLMMMVWIVPSLALRMQFHQSQMTGIARASFWTRCYEKVCSVLSFLLLAAIIPTAMSLSGLRVEQLLAQSWLAAACGFCLCQMGFYTTWYYLSFYPLWVAVVYSTLLVRPIVMRMLQRLAPQTQLSWPDKPEEPAYKRIILEHPEWHLEGTQATPLSEFRDWMQEPRQAHHLEILEALYVKYRPHKSPA